MTAVRASSSWARASIEVSTACMATAVSGSGSGLVLRPRFTGIAQSTRPGGGRCQEHDDGGRSPGTDVPAAERPVPPLPAHATIVLGGGLAGSRHYDGRMPLFGTPVVRREDARLLTGGAQYVSNLDIPGAVHVTYVTATMAHALIADIDVRDAWKVAGVLEIVTADDIDIGPMGFIDKTWPAAMARPPPSTRRARRCRR